MVLSLLLGLARTDASYVEEKNDASHDEGREG